MQDAATDFAYGSIAAGALGGGASTINNTIAKYSNNVNPSSGKFAAKDTNSGNMKDITIYANDISTPNLSATIQQEIDTIISNSDTNQPQTSPIYESHPLDGSNVAVLTKTKTELSTELEE